MIIFFAAEDGEALYSKQKQDQELTVVQIMSSLLPNSDINLRKLDLTKKKYDLCSFTSKPFNITVSQVYGPTTNAEEAEVERFYEDLQDLRELTPPKDVLFIIGDWNAKVGSQETPGCCC